MKFTLLFALASVFTGVISAPVAVEDSVAIEKRQTNAASIVGTLNSAIAGPVASIQSSLATIDSSSSAADKSTVQSAVTAQISQIVDAVNTATTATKALPPASESARLARRQDALQTALTTLLTEINGIAETLVADLGLTTTLSILNPLVGSLSNLLLSLEVVVNNLLALVQTIVDDLLNGLSAGLAGLTL